VHLERTFAEYKESLFAQPGFGFDTCQGCHMDSSQGVAADDPNVDVPLRRVHEHLWPGVDVALTEFPDRELQRLAVQCSLSNSAFLTSIVLVAPPADFEVTLETEAGHNQPSGAAQDRRMWVEFIAYNAAGEPIFASGDIADDQSEAEADALADDNRRVRMFRDRIFDDEGNPVHMFWDARSVQHETLPARKDTTPAHSVTLTYRLPSLPARIEVRTRMRPMGFDVLEDLVESGHLDESIIDEMPTFTMSGASGEWTPDGDFMRAPGTDDCDRYKCMLGGDCPGSD
jgi:hypothetical protein